MKKKIEWLITHCDGQNIWPEDEEGPEGFCYTRQQARDELSEKKKNIFKPWNANLRWPLKIVRREWAVIDERVVR